MPVLEAMAFDKPVLCSDVTSLPEVAGNAALLFDPHVPEAIAGAIQSALTGQATAQHALDAAQEAMGSK